MLRTVEKHDLSAWCAACGTTLQALSEDTGLTEETLRGFAAGEIGLSARHRLNILAALNINASRLGRPVQLDAAYLPVEPWQVTHDLLLGVGNALVTESVLHQLLREIEEEEEPE